MVVEAYLAGNLADGFLCTEQAPGCLVHSQVHNISRGGHVEEPLEPPFEMIERHMEHSGQVGNFDLFIQMGVNVVHCL